VVITVITLLSISGYALKLSSDIVKDKSYYNITGKYGDTFKKNESIYVKDGKLTFNNSLCVFMSQISVRQSNKIVTVCMYIDNIRVDIREFYSNLPSIKGIWFSLNEWVEFCKMIYDINKIVNFQQVYKLQRQNITDGN
jgi:hypothetical protein